MINMQFVQDFIIFILPIYVAALGLYAVRAFKGPTIPDQVLAIDAMSYDLAAFLIVLSIFFKEPILIGTAIVLALWTYALDIYVSKYLQGREMGE